MGKKRFVCTWVNNWREITERKVFTLAEAGVLLLLQAFIGYRDNTIRNPDTGYPLSKREIAELIGKSVVQLDRIMEGLIWKVAIIEQKHGKQNCYIMNPCLFWKGTEKDVQYFEIYNLFLEIKNKRLAENPEPLWGVRVNGYLIPLIYDR